MCSLGISTEKCLILFVFILCSKRELAQMLKETHLETRKFNFDFLAA